MSTRKRRENARIPWCCNSGNLFWFTDMMDDFECFHTFVFNQNLLKPKLLSTDGKVVFLPKASTKAKQIAASEHAIMNAVYQGYPVTIQIGASSNCFQNYRGGVMTCNCNGPVDHVVLVVGWTPTTFIIRNQWGTSWGDQGYAYFPRGIKGGQCHMLSGGPMYLKDVTPVQSGRRSLRSSDAEA